MTPFQGPSSRDVEGLNEDEVYVRDWTVKVGDSFKDPNVCANVIAHFAPPSVRGVISDMESDHFISRLMLGSYNLSALVAVGVTRFQRGMQEYEEFSKKKEKMKSSMAVMKKEIDGFSKKEEAWVKNVGAYICQLRLVSSLRFHCIDQGMFYEKIGKFKSVRC
ncbi:hypothetical protein Hdeb2414_s0003g00105201 [Helianthus debilis subsp. tardiflorus]